MYQPQLVLNLFCKLMNFQLLNGVLPVLTTFLRFYSSSFGPVWVATTDDF